MSEENPTPPSPDSSPAPDTTIKEAAASTPVARPAKSRIPFRPILVGVVALIILIIGVPMIIRSSNTVSTDDAYVNSYVTFVAPRVTGQVAQVLVDDNNRVKKGDILVQLDPEPYQFKLAIAQAASLSALTL